jgi:26S proteasome regulatory subunit N1
MEISSLAALSLGFIFVGSKNGDVSSTMLQTLMEKHEAGDRGLEEKWAKFFALGLALIFLGGSLLAVVYPPVKCSRGILFRS